ncbi:MAG: ferritin family protein [Rhodospirillaceae bacterium]|nr:ferritin family protein [Rhodospirillales bacterium]
MNSVEEFLVYAARLEQEAALRFDELADAAASFSNREVAEFFRQMAHFSRLHLAEAKKRGGFQNLPEMSPGQFEWPDSESPEATAIWGADPNMDVNQAMDLALEAEKRGLAFYADVLAATTDPEIKVMAAEFVEEEAEHVAAIERWIERLAA